MKKTLILIIISLSYTSVFSQNFSLKGGISLSNIKYSGDDPNVIVDAAVRTGVMFGAVTQFGEDNIKYSTELLFNQKGNKEDIHLNYLDLAFKGNFFFNDEISLNVGPSLSYFLLGEYNDGQSWKKFNDEMLDDVNSLTYNACFGLSYKINDLLILDYSYVLMLNSILKDTDDVPDLRSSSSIISVSYMFDY